MEDVSFQSSPRQVVVVDDDSGMRSALRMLLERRGYEVLEFATGGELLACLAARPNEPPYCVLLDLHLEGMSGLETRNRMGDPGFPVILITGDVQGGSKMPVGLFQGVLYKPLNWLDLCALLQAFGMSKAG
jgi:FixJ family two-component response regulator